MTRILVCGYLDQDLLPDNHLNPTRSSGLSELGEAELLAGGLGLRLSQLEDITTQIEQE